MTSESKRHQHELEEGLLLPVVADEKRTLSDEDAYPGSGYRGSTSPTTNDRTTGRMVKARRLLVTLVAFLFVSFGLTSVISAHVGCTRHHGGGQRAMAAGAADASDLSEPAGEPQPDLLHRLLHAYLPKSFQDGVYASDEDALSAVEADDASLGAALAQLAKRQDNNNTESAPPPATTPEPSTQAPPPTTPSEQPSTPTTPPQESSVVTTRETSAPPPAVTTTNEPPPSPSTTGPDETTVAPPPQDVTTTTVQSPPPSTPATSESPQEPSTTPSAAASSNPGSAPETTPATTTTTTAATDASNAATTTSSDESTQAATTTTTTSSRRTTGAPESSSAVLTTTRTTTDAEGDLVLITETSYVGVNPSAQTTAGSDGDGNLQDAAPRAAGSGLVVLGVAAAVGAFLL